MNRKPIGALEAILLTSKLKREAEQKYTWPYKEKKIAAVGVAAQRTIDFYNKIPIGCSFEESKDVRTKLYTAAEEHAKVGILPLIGFSTIIWWILSGVVGWVVRRILDEKFGTHVD